MIDFDALVLGPLMDTFARPISVNPLVSIPGILPYDARGVWSVKPTIVLMEDGSQLSTENRTFGLRLSEFSVAPHPGDLISAPAIGSLPEVTVHRIDDIDSDGQGGITCSMKEWEP